MNKRLAKAFKCAVFMLVTIYSFNTVSAGVLVVLETEKGLIHIEVDTEQAPISSNSFLAHLDAGLYKGAGFYRTVYPANDNGSPKISVLQGGLLADGEALAPVAHETTEQTGILHKDGVISLARAEVGTGSGAAFFICIGDQPALDMGGGRAVSGDGQGFAAFGRVVAGMDVVRTIHKTKPVQGGEDSYTAGQILNPPVRIVKAYRQRQAEN